MKPKYIPFVAMFIVAALTVPLAARSSQAESTPHRSTYHPVRQIIEPVGPLPRALPHHQPFARMTLRQIARHQQHAIAHYRGVARSYARWRRNHHRQDVAYVFPRSRCPSLREAPPHWCWYADAAAWTSRELSETEARLRAEAIAAARPAHMAGWICIHEQEGVWNSETGNGFHGGLQMTYGWMHLVGDAGLLSPLQQMQAAETGYRISGYSHAWMAGQWPHTYPSCAKYF